jgi:hypothetical protein
MALLLLATNTTREYFVGNDLYTRLAEVPTEPTPNVSAAAGRREEGTPYRPSTRLTASIETIDNDYVASLLGDSSAPDRDGPLDHQWPTVSAPRFRRTYDQALSTV